MLKKNVTIFDEILTMVMIIEFETLSTRNR